MTFRQFDLKVTRGLKAVAKAAPAIIAGGVSGYLVGNWLFDQFSSQVGEVTNPNAILDIRYSHDGLTSWTDTPRGTYIADPSGTRGPYPSHDLLH